MNDDEKDARLDMTEGITNNNAAPTGGDSLSDEEIETDGQEELTRQIEVETGAPPETRNPAHLSLVDDSDDYPPDWPDF